MDPLVSNISEGTPEQVDSELGVVEERFLVSVLVVGSFPFSDFLRWKLSSSPSSLCLHFSGGGPLDTISSFVISR
jgi:hypothetical protein